MSCLQSSQLCSGRYRGFSLNCKVFCRVIGGIAQPSVRLTLKRIDPRTDLGGWSYRHERIDVGSYGLAKGITLSLPRHLNALL